MGIRLGSRAVCSLGDENVRKIAVFRALHLGDFICAVPALKALKKQHPLAELTYIGLPWLRAIADRFACIDRFLEFPGYLGLEGLSIDGDASQRFVRDARDYRYDLAIQMHGDGSVSNEFVAQLGARVSIGYRPIGCDLPNLLDLELEIDREEHEVLRWLRLVEVLGAQGSPDLEFPLLADDLEEANAVLLKAGIDPAQPLLAIHPGAKDPERRWPVASFAAAADLLAEQLGTQVVITGTASEAAIGRAVAESMSVPAAVLSGCSSIGGLAALLARASLLITNDTGPSHLAAAIGVPSVVLFGPTKPSRWAPLDVKKHRAIWSGCGNPISQIPVSRVVDESLELVSECASQMS